MCSSKTLSIKSIYVVRRAFKSKGVFYAAGSIISEPADIKRFRSKLADRKIVLVTKRNYQEVAGYILNKSGISILSKLEETFADEPDHVEPPKPKMTYVFKEAPKKSSAPTKIAKITL